MTSFMIEMGGNGRLKAATAGAAPGPASDGAVYRLVNCPDGATVEDIMAVFRGFKPAEGQFEIDFPQMMAKRSSCCGSCGG